MLNKNYPGNESFTIKLKKLQDKLQRGHATRRNLPAIRFATPLHDKLQQILRHVTIALAEKLTFLISLMTAEISRFSVLSIEDIRAVLLKRFSR